MAPLAAAVRPVRLGLSENWRQFVLLLVVNGCVGGMVGLERTVVPLIGVQDFHLATTALVTSFIVSFGVAKALTDLVSGSLADRFGRKPILLAGWLVGLPVPLLIMAAPNWGWIVAANALLGLNQGLTWSMTVNMKIDLVGPKERGLALGLNEFSGYAAVGLTAFLTGLIATKYGLRPAPFYLGLVYAPAGFLLSLLLVRDTGAHLALERQLHQRSAAESLSFWRIFARVSVTDRSLFAASQAGLVNNLNDGMSWGILPQRLATIVRGADTARLDLAPEAPGLLAASLGLSRLYADDLQQLEAGIALYDAFFRWCRDATDETHNWPAKKGGS